jgi:hypothetical protein
MLTLVYACAEEPELLRGGFHQREDGGLDVGGQFGPDSHDTRQIRVGV